MLKFLPNILEHVFWINQMLEKKALTPKTSLSEEAYGRYDLVHPGEHWLRGLGVGSTLEWLYWTSLPKLMLIPIYSKFVGSSLSLSGCLNTVVFWTRIYFTVCYLISQSCTRHQMETFSALLASGAELWCCCFLSAPWINGWVNKGEAGDLRRHRAHYDVIVMNIRKSE